MVDACVGFFIDFDIFRICDGHLEVHVTKFWATVRVGDFVDGLCAQQETFSNKLELEPIFDSDAPKCRQPL